MGTLKDYFKESTRNGLQEKEGFIGSEIDQSNYGDGKPVPIGVETEVLVSHTLQLVEDTEGDGAVWRIGILLKDQNVLINDPLNDLLDDSLEKIILSAIR